MPQSGKIGEAQIEDLHIVFFHEFQDFLRIGLGISHSISLLIYSSPRRGREGHVMSCRECLAERPPELPPFACAQRLDIPGKKVGSTACIDWGVRVAWNSGPQPTFQHTGARPRWEIQCFYHRDNSHLCTPTSSFPNQLALRWKSVIPSEAEGICGSSHRNAGATGCELQLRPQSCQHLRLKLGESSNSR